MIWLGGRYFSLDCSLLMAVTVGWGLMLACNLGCCSMLTSDLGCCSILAFNLGYSLMLASSTLSCTEPTRFRDMSLFTRVGHG